MAERTTSRRSTARTAARRSAAPRAKRTDPSAVARRLASAGVEAVALLHVNNAGVTLVKSIPLRRFAEVCGTGVGLSPVFTVFLSDDSITTSPGVSGPAGDLRLTPDPDATVALAGLPRWAVAAVDQMQQDGTAWPGCGRSFAKGMLERLAGRGLEIRGAYELEFFAGQRVRASGGEQEPDPIPGHTGPAYGATVLIDNAAFAADVIGALEAQGTGVMQFHPEYAIGQFEVSIPHTSGVAIADTNLVLRQTVRAVARTHGLDVSFAAVAFAGLVGNGDHLHFSLWDRGGRNLFAGGRGPEGMGPTAEAFCAGVLAELPALVAISCPSVPSYLRLQPHRWASAYTCWGLENREAALRFVRGTVGTERVAANMEIKPVDGSGNPYLVLGAVIAAGLAGIERGDRLPEPITDDPASVSTARRKKMGIRRLPTTLGEAIRELERSTLLRDTMGDLLFDSFLASRRGEWEAGRKLDDEALVRAHRWRY